jgi:hypothetical protein
VYLHQRAVIRLVGAEPRAPLAKPTVSDRVQTGEVGVTDRRL